jgi:hypothetical protein
VSRVYTSSRHRSAEGQLWIKMLITCYPQGM